MQRRRTLVGMIAIAAFFAAACGGTPPSAQQAPSAVAPTTAGTEASTIAIEEIYAQIDGLEGQARREALLAIASEEEGAVSLYTSTGIEDITPVIEGLSDELGIETSLYRSGSREVFQRVLQEADAGRLGADVVLVGREDMAALTDEGLLLPLTTPVAEDLVPDGLSDAFAPVYLVVHVAAWNTEQLAGKTPPSTWEELLASPPVTPVAFDQTDYAWFATLVQEHFVGQLGMTEDEAIQLFKDAMPAGLVMRGHSAGMELLLSGELPIHAAQYLHTIRDIPSEAPVEWEPVLEPLIYLAYSVGITEATTRPASSLLFIDYLLSADEGQSLLASVGRTPANTRVQEGGIPPEYESMGVPDEISLEDRDKWEQLWLDEVITLVGEDRT